MSGARAQEPHWAAQKERGGFALAQLHDPAKLRGKLRHSLRVRARAADRPRHMPRAQGFAFGDANVSLPYLWWRRTKDLGLPERWSLRAPPPPGRRKETLVNVAARKPPVVAESSA